MSLIKIPVGLGLIIAYNLYYIGYCPLFIQVKPLNQAVAIQPDSYAHGPSIQMEVVSGSKY